MRGFLPDETRLTQVHLRTRSLQRGIDFYSNVLGLKASYVSNSQAILASTADKPALLVLTEDRNASPRRPRATGLYHFALRYATRGDLAQAFRRVLNADHPVAGASDHGVSEAIYLSDPDGNGLQLCADRPRSQWPRRNGQLAMVTTPLDLGKLSAVSPGSPRDLPTELGHIHLHVADLAEAERFYSDFLGLAVIQRNCPGALFFGAGEYHHQVAVNVWAGTAAGPISAGARLSQPQRPRNCDDANASLDSRAPENLVGLVSYRLEVPVEEIIYCLRHRAPLLGYEAQMQPANDGNSILQIGDPNGNWLEVWASQHALIAGPAPHSADGSQNWAEMCRQSAKFPGINPTNIRSDS
jgi:catechol 2,3-dioxygenase